MNMGSAGTISRRLASSVQHWTLRDPPKAATIGDCNNNQVTHRLQAHWSLPGACSNKLATMIKVAHPSDLAKALDDVPGLGIKHALFAHVPTNERRDVADAFFMKAINEVRGPPVAPLPAAAPYLRAVVVGSWPVVVRASTVPEASAPDFEALLPSGLEVSWGSVPLLALSLLPEDLPEVHPDREYLLPQQTMSFDPVQPI